MAADIAERIRKSIKELVFTYNEIGINVTISIGLSTYTPGKLASKTSAEISSQLIHSADSALYVAKEKGRDRVVIGSEVQTEETQRMVS